MPKPAPDAMLPRRFGVRWKRRLRLKQNGEDKGNVPPLVKGLGEIAAIR